MLNKTVFAVMATALTFFTVSCGKKDKKKDPQSEISGTWGGVVNGKDGNLAKGYFEFSGTDKLTYHVRCKFADGTKLHGKSEVKIEIDQEEDLINSTEGEDFTVIHDDSELNIRYTCGGTILPFFNSSYSLVDVEGVKYLTIDGSKLTPANLDEEFSTPYDEESSIYSFDETTQHFLKPVISTSQLK